MEECTMMEPDQGLGDRGEGIVPSPSVPYPLSPIPSPILTPRVMIGIIAGCGLVFLFVMLLGGPNLASDDKKDPKKDEKAEKKDDSKDDPPEPKKKVAAPDLD